MEHKFPMQRSKREIKTTFLRTGNFPFVILYLLFRLQLSLLWQTIPNFHPLTMGYGPPMK